MSDSGENTARPARGDGDNVANTKGTRMTYHCSFCGKSQDQVQQLISGPGGVRICDECIDLCREIIEESTAKPRGQQERIQLPPPAENEAPPPNTDALWEHKAVRAKESAIGSTLSAESRLGWEVVGIAPRTLSARRPYFELEAEEYVLVLRRPVPSRS